MEFQLSYFKSWKMILRKCCTQYPANSENSAVATGLEKVSFHSNPKERQCPRMLKHRTIALTSLTSKIMLKILQARLQQYVNQGLSDVQAGFRKDRGTRDQLANIWSQKKQRNFRKTSASLTTLKPLTVWITTSWKILKKMGIPDPLTCLLRNLCADQEATIRTLHGTTDLFKIGKGVPQGCISSPYLFNFCRVHHGKCQTGWITSWNQDC